MANYMKLTPSTEKYLEGFPKIDASMLTLDMMRGRPDLALPLSIPRPDVDVEEMSIAGATGLIKVTIYRPSNSHIKGLPALVFIHGGGWVTEAKASFPYVCSKIADEANCAVIFVHYSLSPEVKFPVAIEECYAVVAWATNPNNSGFLKIDPTKVAIGGDSAGGNLAIAVSLLAKQRDNLENKIKYQVLFYPVTDAVFNTASYYEFGTGYGLNRDMMQFCWDNYVPEMADRENILASPMRATKEELKDLPPALVISAEADVLRDEAENFGRKLLSVGVPVTTTRVLGVLHGFLTNVMLFSDETLFALDMATAALRRTFA